MWIKHTYNSLSSFLHDVSFQMNWLCVYLLQIVVMSVLLRFICETNWQIMHKAQTSVPVYSYAFNTMYLLLFLPCFYWAPASSSPSSPTPPPPPHPRQVHSLACSSSAGTQCCKVPSRLYPLEGPGCWCWVLEQKKHLRLLQTIFFNTKHALLSTLAFVWCLECAVRSDFCQRVRHVLWDFFRLIYSSIPFSETKFLAESLLWYSIML